MGQTCLSLGSGDAAEWRHVVFLHLQTGKFKHRDVFVPGFKEWREPSGCRELLPLQFQLWTKLFAS